MSASLTCNSALIPSRRGASFFPSPVPGVLQGLGHQGADRLLLSLVQRWHKEAPPVGLYGCREGAPSASAVGLSSRSTAEAR